MKPNKHVNTQTELLTGADCGIFGCLMKRFQLTTSLVRFDRYEVVWLFNRVASSRGWSVFNAVQCRWDHSLQHGYRWQGKYPHLILFHFDAFWSSFCWFCNIPSQAKNTHPLACLIYSLVATRLTSSPMDRLSCCVSRNLRSIILPPCSLICPIAKHPAPCSAHRYLETEDVIKRWASQTSVFGVSTSHQSTGWEHWVIWTHQ